MKSPFADCNATLMQEKRELKFRNETFPYIAHFYRCDETGIDFTTTEQDDESIGQVYSQYRSKYGIPTAEEIRDTRLRYGFSAARMSAILGLGINQYRLYEAGEMPSASIGKVLKCIENPRVFQAFLALSEKQFKPRTYEMMMRKVSSLSGGHA